MMDCERHWANVFEVIELINRDYPRGGIAQPGLTAGTCLRKDFAFSEERSSRPGMLLAVSRVNESVPLFLVEGIKRRLGSLRDRRIAVLGLAFKADTDDERDSLAHKLIRLLERELADVVVHDPRVSTPTATFEQAVDGRRGGRRRDQPLRFRHAHGPRRDRRPRDDRLPARRPLELLGHLPGLRLHRRARARPAGVNRVLVTGGAGTIGAAVVRRLLADPGYEVRVSDQRQSPQWMREGCEIHTGDLRELERGAAGDRRLLARHPPRGDRRRHRQLPPPPAHAHARPTTRSRAPSSAPPSSSGSSASSTSPPRWSSSAPTCSRRPRTTSPTAPCPRSAYGFSKLAGEVYCRAANEEHGLPYTICRPFNAYGPGETPDREPGIAHAVPDLIAKALAGQRPLQIFGSGEQTRTLTHVDDIADGIVSAMSSPAGLEEDFNISASRELTVAEIARIVWTACGQDPVDFALEPLPSFPVDVQRRWPSVEKARRLLGWEARIDARAGDRRDRRVVARAGGLDSGLGGPGSGLRPVAVPLFDTATPLAPLRDRLRAAVAGRARLRPLHPRSRGGRLRAGVRCLLRRLPRRSRRQRHRRHHDRPARDGDRPRRRGGRALVHLLRHRRGGLPHRGHAGLLRRRPGHLLRHRRDRCARP